MLVCDHIQRLLVCLSCFLLMEEEFYFTGAGEDTTHFPRTLLLQWHLILMPVYFKYNLLSDTLVCIKLCFELVQAIFTCQEFASIKSLSAMQAMLPVAGHWPAKGQGEWLSGGNWFEKEAAVKIRPGAFLPIKFVSLNRALLWNFWLPLLRFPLLSSSTSVDACIRAEMSWNVVHLSWDHNHCTTLPNPLINGGLSYFVEVMCRIHSNPFALLWSKNGALFKTEGWFVVTGEVCSILSMLEDR